MMRSEVKGLVSSTRYHHCENADIAPPERPRQQTLRQNKLQAVRFKADGVRKQKYSRCASVTVFIGNGFNAAAPGHGDVTALETHINTDH